MSYTTEDPLDQFDYTLFHHSIQMPLRNVLSDVANICHSFISFSKGKLRRQQMVVFYFRIFILKC